MNGAVTAAKMEPRGSSVSPLRTRKRSRTLGLRKTTLGSRSGRSNGRAECREKKIGIEPKGSTFFLTFPLIGHCYIDEFRCGDVEGILGFRWEQHTELLRTTAQETGERGESSGRHFCSRSHRRGFRAPGS